ncbi:LytR/AlgR family response regulator transcription factor [Spirosoma validum]|uniref:LytTR family transcriptional regulator DNA-binding domain-containing protein n=1 Tax=Spirosoma validum TaxID=2771355 RepID=A0A927AZ53_9BACT|nr:LytTR family transcriptional regulator DNA-binding domain-containing protein [Spirosoma validum]MBD2752327.1 LytTR family transcriptional regulator DNA-binding domain-containing protein [Spirosoma validum]
MTFPLKTILIDDEPLAISRLRRLLDKYRDTFEVIGEASNGAEGLTLIEAEQPDVIFLDIEMPLLNGFEMLSKVTTVPMVIFATAFNQYAIRAFEENSVDYLLKPIETDRLARTAQKIRSLVERNETQPNSNPMTESVMRLLAQMQPKKEIYSISVKTGEKIILVPLSDIAYFEAEDKYVFLSTTEGQKYLTNYTLTTLNEKLPDTFVRISRSAMVNRQKISEVHRHFDGKFVLAINDKKGTKLTTGSTYGDAVRQLMEL